MKLALMQPYLFPYLGYFQLIHSVDTFVCYDDAQFMKGGWINRNRILHQGQDHLFTISIQKAPLTNRINDRVFSHRFEWEQKKFLKLLQANYRDAPYQEQTLRLVEEIMQYPETNVARKISHSLQVLARYMKVDTTILCSSDLKLESTSKGEERVIEICQHLHATEYINSIGGMSLYSKERFAEAKIHLQFLRSKQIEYAQFDHPFVPHLSILDVLMFNSIEQIQKFLDEYELI